MDRNPVIRLVPLTNVIENDIIQDTVITEEGVVLTHEQLLEIEQIVGIPLGPFPTSLASIAGHTMDTQIIAFTHSAPVRAFYEDGVLDPAIIEESEGAGLAAHPVTTYMAVFNDRDRELVITEETYRAMVENVEPHNEAPTEEGVERLQTSMEPISGDRQTRNEPAVDGHGRTRPYREDTRFPARTPSTIAE